MFNFDISFISKLRSTNEKLFDKYLIRLIYSFCVDINIINKIKYLKNNYTSREERIKEYQQHCIKNGIFDFINKKIYNTLMKRKGCDFHRVIIPFEDINKEYIGTSDNKDCSDNDDNYDYYRDNIVLPVLFDNYKGFDIDIEKERSYPDLIIIWHDPKN